MARKTHCSFFLLLLSASLTGQSSYRLKKFQGIAPAYQKFCSRTSIILVLAFGLINLTSCEFLNPNQNTTRDTTEQLVAYANHGNIVHLIDPYTFQVKETIDVEMPDNTEAHRLTLSENGEFLIFCNMLHSIPYTASFVAYDIEERRISAVFETSFDSIGAPRIHPAINDQRPGLIYFYTHSHGMYLIDVFSEDYILQISSEKGVSISKTIKYTKNMEYTGLLTSYPAYDKVAVYSSIDLELTQPLFTMNTTSIDSINVIDFELSENGKKVYATYTTARYQPYLVGEYFFDSATLMPYDFKLPWSINPYYVAISISRKELYTIGGANTLYIIDLEGRTIKGEIEIDGKSEGYASRIAIRDDERLAFVSCSRDNFIAVIDLEKRELIHRIDVDLPYLLLNR